MCPLMSLLRIGIAFRIWESKPDCSRGINRVETKVTTFQKSLDSQECSDNNFVY